MIGFVFVFLIKKFLINLKNFFIFKLRKLKKFVFFKLRKIKIKIRIKILNKINLPRVFWGSSKGVFALYPRGKITSKALWGYRVL